MQIYAIAHRLDGHARMSLEEAVSTTARSFADPHLSPAQVLHVRGPALEVAAAAHEDAYAGSRRYRAQAGSTVVAYDGLPIAVDGSFHAEDAAQLAQRWATAVPDGLTGIFTAVRADLETGEVECMTDPLGLARVYLVQRGDGWALSTSIAVLQRLVGAATPDLTAMSSLLTLGWAVGGRTLLEDIGTLAPGHVHRFGPRARSSVDYGSEARLAVDRPRRSLAELTQRMVTATQEASRVAAGPLVCGITAGRDSRVLMALARAAGAEARYHTVHLPGADEDVEGGRRLAAAVGAPHEVVEPAVPASAEEWTAQTARFMAQLEGAASIASMSEWLEHQRPRPTLGVRLWGMGGEVGRAAIGLGTAVAGNAWGLRSWRRPQDSVVHRKVLDGGGLVRPEAVDRTHRYLDGFVDDRLAEGWPVREAAEAYYAFERVRNLFHAGTRRSAATVDAYSPFSTYDFLEYSFACTPGERYIEAPHHRLMVAFDRELMALPWDRPWRPQRPTLAPVMVVGEAARLEARRAAGKVRARRPSSGPGPLPFGHQWMEGGVAPILELVRSRPDSPVWQVADRAGVQRLLEGTPEDRRPRLEHLARIATILLYFDGPR
jgi:hypothetical protein